MVPVDMQFVNRQLLIESALHSFLWEQDVQGAKWQRGMRVKCLFHFLWVFKPITLINKGER